MKNKYLLVLIVLFSISTSHAQQASRLIALTKTKFDSIPTPGSFVIQDTVWYKYSSNHDTTNGGGIAYDSSATLAYAAGLTVNDLSYRYYQTLVANNITAIKSQFYDTSTASWTNYQLNNATFNGNNNVTLRIIQQWDTLGNAWVNYTKTINTFSGTNLTVKVRQNWITYLNAWRNNIKDSFSFDGNNNTLYHLVQDWDTVGNVWVNSDQFNYTYNGLNQVTDNHRQTWNVSGNAWVDTLNTLYHYNGLNLLANTIVQNYIPYLPGFRNLADDSLTYNGGNDIKLEIKQSWDTTNTSWRNLTKNFYTYDVNHNMLTDTISTWNNNNSIYRYTRLRNYSYNTYNQVLVFTTISWNIPTQMWVYKPADQQWRYYYELYDTTGVVPQSVNNVAADNSILIYPSPATSQLTIKLSWQYPQPFTIAIYNIAGEVVRQWGETATAAYQTSISIDGLPSGTYFLKATGNDKQVAKQFVIVH